MHSGKQDELSSQNVDLSKILDRIGPIAYRLSLPSELSNVHDVFHLSNLKMCLSDETFCLALKQKISEHQVDHGHRVSPLDGWSE